MAKIHHIFINYNVLTNNFHTYQLFTSSSPLQLPIVFPILAPPFLPSPPRFLAVNDCLSYYLLRPVLLSSPRYLAGFATLSCQLLCSVLLFSPRYLAVFISLSCQLLRIVLLSSPRCLARCSQSFLSAAPHCPAIFATLSCQLFPVFPTACVTLSSFLTRSERVNIFRPSPILSTPFYTQEHALQHSRTCPS